MARQNINAGTGNLRGDGESLHAAFSKINENFIENYGTLANHDTRITALEDGSITTDIIGSVFGDDSTLLIDGVSNTFNLNGTISGNVVPDTNEAYDLGSPDAKFRELYLSGNTINIGDTQVKAEGTGIVLPEGSKIGERVASTLDLEDISLLLQNLTIDLLPDADSDGVTGRDLGSPTRKWRDLYLSSGSLFVNNRKVIEDDSGTITVKTDQDQNLRINTSGTGQTTIDSHAGLNLSTTGSADIEVATDSGQLEINADTVFDVTKSITSSTGEELTFNAGANFGTNLVTADIVGTVSDISNHSTDNLIEGVTNRYYADSLARNAISAKGDLSYNPSTGEMSFFQRTVSQVRDLFSAAGDLSYNNLTGEFSVSVPQGYDSTDFNTDFADKSTTDLSEGANLYYTDERVQIVIDQNAAGFITDYTVTENDVTQYEDALTISEDQITDLQNYLTSETVTSLVDNGDNTLTYTDEQGSTTSINLSLYLDDTNLSRLTSGTLNGETGVATFIREDATTFTVDFSPLFDDTNLARITSASFNPADGVLALTRNDASDVTVDLDGRYLTSVNGTVTGSLIPDTDITYDLGSSSNRFRDIYLSGSTIDLAGTHISTDTAGDVEITDSLNNRKKIIAGEVEIGTGTERIKLARDEITGRIKFDRFDATTGQVLGATSADLSENNTDDLKEGSNNRYFTNSLARNAVSVSGDLSYNALTGVISFTERTDVEVRQLLSVTNAGGDGSLEYNSTTGVFTYTGPSAAEARTHFSASGDLSYNNITGEFSFTERTDAEVRGLFRATGDLSYNSATGEFSVNVPAGYTSSDFDTDFDDKSTTDLSEGANLYYTDERVQSVIDQNSAGFITDYMVTESDVTQYQSALTISENQISDLQNYLVSSDLNSYATKSYVDSEISTLVASAPGTLDTLNELASALGNDANFATTVSNQIGQKANTADLASVAVSGSYNDLSNLPTIPSNTNQLANGAGFITDYTVTQADVTQHESSITITKAQISDLSVPTNTSDLNNDTGFISAESDTLDTVTNRGFSTTNAISVGALTSNGILSIQQGTQESFSVLSSATGTVTHNCANGTIFYHNAPSSNWKANFTNVTLAINYATAFTIVINQGATAYIPTEIQIGGESQTILWQGGSEPSGTANGLDIVSFSILNDGGTYIVTGQLSSFEGA
jgi:hypothetical protein